MNSGIESPVSGFSDMSGWPGTIPPRRLRLALEAIRARALDDLQENDELRRDAMGLMHAKRINALEKQGNRTPGLEGTEEQRGLRSAWHWEDVLMRARMQDDQHNIGGIIVQKQEKTEDRMVFQIQRHPDWMGLNRALPLMEGMRVMVLESHAIAGEPGLVIAESNWDAARPGSPAMPSEQGRLLARILSWHGVREIRWLTRE